MNVTILYSGNQGTTFDVFLVDALLREPGVSQVTLVLGLGRSGGQRMLRQAIDHAQYVIGRVARPTVALDALQARGARIVRVSEISTSVGANAVDGADLVIDFADLHRAGPPGFGAPAPRLELWSDGCRADLSHSLPTTRNHQPGAGPRLEVTLWDGRHDRRVVERSNLPSISPYPAIDRRNAQARSVSLLVRALRKVHSTEEREPHVGVATPRSIVRELASLVTVTGKAAARLLARKWVRDDEWFLAYRTDAKHFVARTASPIPSEFRLLNAGGGRFFADPCVISRNGRTFVFLEDYRSDLGRGVISCTELSANGYLGAPFTVLTEPFHLSYPFVFEHAGAVFMVPESSANRTVSLYAATDFPYSWERRYTLLEGINGTDATLHHDGTRWWMFVAVGEFGAAAWDELSLFYSDRLEGPWFAHPQNPVKRDAASARPAGPLFHRNGKLIRPAQDCSRVYGGAVKLCEISELTTHSFAERVVDTIPSSWLRARALHTLSAMDGVEVIDGRR